MRLKTQARGIFGELKGKLGDLREWAETPDPKEMYGPVRGGRWYVVAVALLAGVLATTHFGFIWTGDSSDRERAASEVAEQRGADGGSARFLDPPPRIPDVVAEQDVSDVREERPRPAVAPVAGPPVVPPSQAGIPATMLKAYRKAADNLRTERPGCGISVPLLAAIGQVESRHAYGGRVDTTGRAVTPIVGVALDGRPSVALIRDTDGGRWDGDAAYDRAVGPMQFIPTTWARWAADGNGDGVRDPQNAYDATLASGRYLCTAGGDVTTDIGLRRAVLAYNRSEHYLDVVLSWMRVYAGGATAVPDGAHSVDVGNTRLLSGVTFRDGSAESGSSSSTGSSSSGKSTSKSSSSTSSEKSTSTKENSSTGEKSSSGSSGGSGGSGEDPSPSPSPSPSPPPPEEGEDPPPEEPSEEPEEPPEEPSEEPEEEPEEEEPVVRLNPNPPSDP